MGRNVYPKWSGADLPDMILVNTGKNRVIEMSYGVFALKLL